MLESRKQLQRLEFFSIKADKEKSNLISLLIAASKIKKAKAAENTSQPRTLSSIARDVAKRKRKYERILSEESNLVISTPGSFISKTSQRVVVREKRRKVKEVPLFR